MNRTIIGKAIRAGIENVEHVESLGINVARLFTITFIIAGTLSGLAGGLHTPLAEKVSALKAAEFFADRIARARPDRLEGILAKAVDYPPVP